MTHSKQNIHTCAFICKISLILVTMVTSLHFQTLKESLKTKEAEIDSLRKLGLSLVDLESHLTPGGTTVQETIDQINSQWAKLDHEVSCYFLMVFLQCS